MLNAKISAAKRSKQFLDWTLDASSLTSFVGSLSIDDGSGLGPKKGGSFLELDPLTVTFLPQHKNGELVSLSILSAGKPLLTVDQKTVRGRTDGITLDRIYSELLGKLSISVKQHTSIHFRPSWDGVGLANLFKVGEDDVLYQ